MLPDNRKWSGLAHPEGWGHEDNAVSSDKQHGDVPLGGLKTHKEQKRLLDDERHSQNVLLENFHVLTEKT